MKRGAITSIVLWTTVVMVFLGTFSKSMKGTLLGWSGFGSTAEELFGQSYQDLVYGGSSHLFWLAKENYPLEYMRYAEYYENRGEWGEFTAPGIPTVQGDRIANCIRKYQTARRPDFELWLKRAGKYLPLMRQILLEHGLPGELVCLAMVESGFDPKAVSGARACGFWQFMPETARRYGLRVDEWVDERMDAERSTVAAAALVSDLYERYGSWDLAIAAYNAGDLLIQEIIGQTGCWDYWELVRIGRFSPETRSLVIKFHSAITILRDLDRYGFVDTPLNPPIVFERVDCPQGTPLKEVAALLGIPEGELFELNPHLIRLETPPDPDAYPLCVPLGMADRVKGYFPMRPIS